MAIFKCKMCGGDLEVSEGISVIECEYCETKQTIPCVDNEKKLNLFNRANRLRMNSEFDKAAAIYENIVAEFSEEAEAYWGLCLCNYGIEYVDDPATAKKIPTCHRASFESIQRDENFELALEYADVVAQKVYRDEAREIDRIMQEILAVSKNEKPYDVFICYKETDEKGERTVDSVLAYDIYDSLIAKGYNVFFSRVTLEDKLGRQYEPYIFAALNSAKVMLSVGTKYEYFHAVWVKNEWSRFLKLMAKDKTKVLIPCYKDMDAYDMPEEFKALQAQDLGKLGAVQDIVRGIEKIIGSSASTQSVTASNPEGSALTMRGYIYLEDGDFSKADSYFDRALDSNPTDSKAYMGKVLCALKLTKLSDIETIEADLSCFKDFERAVRFADGAEKASLEKIKADADKKMLYKKLFHMLAIVTRDKKKKIEYAERRRQLEQAAEERRIREAKAAEEKSIELTKHREKYRHSKNMIAVNERHIAGLNSDGTVKTACDKWAGKHNVEDWRGIVAVFAGYNYTVGLKKDGTVVAVGDNSKGQCDVGAWTDIVAVDTQSRHTVGLKKDGTVVAVGDNSKGQCNVSDWTGISAVFAGSNHTVGLKNNGTVVAVGNNENGQCAVSDWSDIVAVATGWYYTVGLKKDGTVVAVGDNSKGQCNVSDWTDIVAIFAYGYHTVGLKRDGRVVIVGDNPVIKSAAFKFTDIVDICVCSNLIVGLKSDGKLILAGRARDNADYTLSKWTDIVAIFAKGDHIAGLKHNGEVVAVGQRYIEKEDVNKWKLFEDIDNLEEECRIKTYEKAEEERLAAEKAEEERLAAEKVAEEKRLAAEKVAEEKRRIEEQKAAYRTQGVCQHCGGTFKGLFTKKCANCGKEKDY